ARRGRRAERSSRRRRSPATRSRPQTPGPPRSRSAPAAGGASRLSRARRPPASSRRRYGPQAPRTAPSALSRRRPTDSPFLFELGPQLCMRLRERGGDGALADVARGGDLRVGEVAEVAEEDDQTAAWREAADCSLQRRIALGVEQL